MKKHIGLFVFLCSLFMVVSIGETNGFEKNEKTLETINSNNFVEFIKEKNLTNRISQICSNDFCDYVRGNTLEETLEIFKNKYENYIKENSNEEIARSTILKGFPITKINILD